MTDDAKALTAALFLDEAARYFEKRPTGGEDMAHWANVFNAENCRVSAAAIRDLLAERAAALAVVTTARAWRKAEWRDHYPDGGHYVAACELIDALRKFDGDTP